MSILKKSMLLKDNINIARLYLTDASRYTFLLAICALLISGAAISSVDLAEEPLFLKTGAGANVLLNMSVETPMGGAAYNDAAGTVPGCGGRRGDGRGICYFTNIDYIGYFDPKKCYNYTSSVFVPDSAASADHSCDDGQSGRWSGNFLNWAGMTAIDTYMLTMTGGRRIVDTSSRTVIKRSLGSGFFHNKVLDPSNNVTPSTVTPYTGTWAHINKRNDSAFDFETGSGTTTYQLAVEVCNPAVSLEENCVARTDGTNNYYKPEGLIQNNVKKMRFGVMAYTTHDSNDRDGGVLRSNMKSVGPELGTGEANPLKEYNEDGLFIFDPESYGAGVNSGVINYVNNFAVAAGRYKSYDPVSELFYEAVRYFKNIGPTPETYTGAGVTTSNDGGFKILTASDWEDPIQYECQKNFMVAINDAFPWNDKTLPGTYFTGTSTVDALGRTINHTHDQGEPSNADTDLNVTTQTDQVGFLEDTETGGELVTKLGTRSLGKILAPSTGANLTPTGGDGRGNSYYLAGIGYYANTQDLRDDFDGEQTVSTFMIDSQEYNNNPIIGNVNPLWLAGKYGGFVDANNDDTPQVAEWDADGDGVPDNYVLANAPEKMVEKLQESFDAIGKVAAASGSAVAINSTVLNTNSRVYQATFASTDWSGNIKAFSLNTDGSINAEVWNAAAKLPAHADREIYTTVDVSGTATAKTFTDANVTLGGSGSTTTTAVSAWTTGTATGSGNAYGGLPEHAFDQNTDGHHANGSGSGPTTHSNGGADVEDWWNLDMGSEQDISHLNIYNRTDCCKRRLSNTIVMVADTPFTSDSLVTNLANADHVGQITGDPIRINAGSNTDYTDARGRVWEADTAYAKSNTSVIINSDSITNTDSGSLLGYTTDESIYQSQRTRNNDVEFNIPISDTGIDYYVILHFADSSSGADPIVDIEIDGDKMADDYNIGASGNDNAVTKIFKYTDVDSNLEIKIKDESGSDPIISALEIIPEFNSNLFTLNVGIPGRYIRLQKAGLDLSFDFGQDRWLSIAEVEPMVTTTVTVGGASNADIVNYIRGDQSKEESQTNGILRNRTSLIGDLVNSTPVVSGTESFFNSALPSVEGSSYEAYVASKVAKFKTGSNYFNVVYAGANDGMLHAFIDTTDTLGAADAKTGKEIFAYIPSHMHSKLENLTKPDYNHENFVNGPPSVNDVYINSAWRTMLVGAFGSGAKGLYALNISDPENFSASDVMWEFKTDTDVSNGSNEIGHVLTAPKIARFNNGKWGVIFGNGYNSTSQTARLFILDASDGSIMKVINTGVGSFASPNGLSEPILVDEDSDRIVDVAYAGDLLGNMWKFDLTNVDDAQWEVAYETTGSPATPLPLITVSDANGNPQPITSKPAIAFNPYAGGDFNILFGTGKYMEIGDNIIPTSPDVNTMYSVNDGGSAITTGRSVLVEQTILSEQDEYDDQGTPGDSSDDVLTNRVRVTSNHTVDYTTKKGWYMDFMAPDGPDLNSDPDPVGERIIAAPLSRFSRTIFTTYIPSSNPCDGGGVSLLMNLDALSGSRLQESIFDVNNDGFIDANDLVLYNGIATTASGLFIDSTVSNAVILSGGSSGVDIALLSYTSGSTGALKLSSDPTQVGRQSWRQLK